MEKYKNETYTKQRTQGFVKCGCSCIILALGLVAGYYIHEQAKKYSQQISKCKQTIDKVVEKLNSGEENEQGK
ncbi:hypothetical protein HZA97_00645 [Candidatus Woesearchaeota archaeon]|nr:hypothetical protein [Candidatus Woesearchaeota archaeon]